MSKIGVRDLISKSASDIEKTADMFIKSSLNIREGLIHGKDDDICMLSLIRDTYVCNLIIRYVGMMTIVTLDPQWKKIDNKMIEYMQTYYNHKKFKKKIIELYEHYCNKDDKLDYCKFLDKIISKCNMTDNENDLRKKIRMLENKIFNLLNIDPIVKISTKYFKKLPQNYEIKDDKITVHLDQHNYNELIDLVDDIDVRHKIETQYMSRTKHAICDFANLIILRKLLAKEAGVESYFKYINRNKFDNSESVKELITDINQKLNIETKSELDKIYQYFKRTANINTDTKISICDVQKYNRIHKNNTKFNPKHVYTTIFNIILMYFKIKTVKISDISWNSNMEIYELRDSDNNELLGRLYMDIIYNENKKLSDPLSIRLSDKMQINKKSKSISEVALIANYHVNDCMNYNDVVALFREFGYILHNICYESRVGLINYDEEFSNYMPLLMEYIAWDKNTITMIIGDKNPIIIDHIELGKNIDTCLNLKLKCINAKFDHLLHNSEPLMQILMHHSEKKCDVSEIIIQTYQNIYQEIMEYLSDIMKNNIENIFPISIVQEINTSQGFLYANLINEIFAYGSYWIIKNNKDHDFRNCVLNNAVDNYRELIRTFLKKSDINYVELYMNNIIRVQKQYDVTTEDINYFDDRQSDNDSDKDEIIQINRI